MKKPLLPLLLILCLLPFGSALGGDTPMSPENMGERFHLEDGVVYFLRGDAATVAGFMPDAERIVVHAEIDGRPVQCDSIRWEGGMAKSILVEEGVTGIRSVYLAHFPALRTVDIRATTHFSYLDFYDDYHVYLLDCPALTGFIVRENEEPYELRYTVRSSPNVTVSSPPAREGGEKETDDSTRDFLFTDETHPGETVCIIPEGVKIAKIESNTVTRIELPNTLYDLRIDVPDLQEIIVSPQNTGMHTVDGVLYSRDDESLYVYPSGRKDASYTLLPTVEWVSSLQSEYLETLVLPLTADALEYSYDIKCPNLTEIIIPAGADWTDRSIYELNMEDGDNCEDAFYAYGKGSLWHAGQGNLRIIVSEENSELTAMDGLLYTKDGKELLRVPPATKGTLTLPEGTERIAPYAMYGCTAIETLVLPASLRAPLAEEAFFGLAGLRDFEVAADSRDFQAIDGVLFSRDGTILYARPPMHGDSYVVPRDTLHIAPYAFLPNKTLREVHMVPGVVTVGERAFQGNSALSALTLSPTITRIGDYAFENCTRIEKLVLPRGLKHVGQIVGFSEMMELGWYEWDAPDRVAEVERMEIWIPADISSFDPACFTYSPGFTGRTADELLLVVEEGSPGHEFAEAESLPYCFPDQVELAREGYRYAILLGEAGENVLAYESPSMDARAIPYPEGSAFLLLGEENGFHLGQIGGRTVYLPREKCRVVKERHQIWPLGQTMDQRREAPLYAEPSTSAEHLLTLQKGDALTVRATLGPWCRASTADGTRGYALLSDLTNHGYRSAYSAYAKLPALSALLPAYAYPSLDAPILRRLENGAELDIDMAAEDGWILTHDGYVRAEGVVFLPTKWW